LYHNQKSYAIFHTKSDLAEKSTKRGADEPQKARYNIVPIVTKVSFNLESGDTLVFDSVSMMSRNSDSSTGNNATNTFYTYNVQLKEEMAS